MKPPFLNTGSFASLLAAVVTCSLTTPAWADDSKTGNSQANTRASHFVALPKALAGFCAGVVVGTPVCYLRKFPKELTGGAHGLAGSIVENEDNKLLFVPACVAWLPVALVITAVEAPAYAVKDAYTAEKSFSKEQFSLAALDP
jgi:hypothetical protein